MRRGRPALTPARSETPEVVDSSQPPRRLPPLNPLRFFEAAGRLQSIRRAASELSVTPGAVSRQVQVLESWLGVPLFDHRAHSISLTAAGREYLQVVTEQLDALAAATDTVTGRDRGGSVLLVRSYTFFATNWLVPRLTEFHHSEPWVDLQLVTSSRPADFGRWDADAEIRPGPYEWQGYDADLLISDEVVLVCAPAYRTKHQLFGPADLVRLGAAELLRSIASPRLWRQWLEIVGIPGLAPECGPTYGDSVLTCRAAAAGQGVALAPRSLVETEIAAGRLVVPFEPKDGYHISFHLVYPPGQLKSRAFCAFREWLLTQTRTARNRSHGMDSSDTTIVRDSSFPHAELTVGAPQATARLTPS